ncbi:MAG: type II toxin-antitoxin system VapC family toxin [Leptonema illini]|jgi:predicted nucleic acid-binding protein|uniref:Type II toxin-antitoxin system VapC family toxin n=1 Tax=Leptonema illini TaxID=183 RepID=A0A833LXM6_9LEPT|nr:MAG: type II toxin-antitoxin system VapC family toxin [Leptonema illini]
MIRPLYLDTSAAAKLFFSQEKGAAEMAKYLSDIKNSGDSFALNSSDLLKVEMDSVIRRKLKESGQSPADFYEEIRAWQDFERRLIRFYPVSEAITDRARALLKDQRITGTLRTLDSIHLSTCDDLRSRFGQTILIAADAGLLRAAGQIGIETFDPEA